MKVFSEKMSFFVKKKFFLHTKVSNVTIKTERSMENGFISSTIPDGSLAKGKKVTISVDSGGMAYGMTEDM